MQSHFVRCSRNSDRFVEIQQGRGHIEPRHGVGLLHTALTIDLAGFAEQRQQQVQLSRLRQPTRAFAKPEFEAANVSTFGAFHRLA